MGGPIVRSGPTPEFSKNWEQAFGKKSAAAKPKPSKKKAATSKKAKKAKKG
jgi:hypothetical protein